MLSLKVVCSFVLALLVPIYISAQGTSSSPAPTSLFPEDGNTSFLTEQNDLDYFDWTKVFRKLFYIVLRHLTEVENITDFSPEACAASGSSGPCVFTHLVYLFLDGNETCSIYTVGSCDEYVRGYTYSGCIHKCKLITD